MLTEYDLKIWCFFFFMHSKFDLHFTDANPSLIDSRRTSEFIESLPKEPGQFGQSPLKRFSRKSLVSINVPRLAESFPFAPQWVSHARVRRHTDGGGTIWGVMYFYENRELMHVKALSAEAISIRGGYGDNTENSVCIIVGISIFATLLWPLF